MKKIELLLGVLLAAALAFAMPAGADEEEPPEYECCCAVTCKWQYTILNPACVQSDKATGTVESFYSACVDAAEGAQTTCESQIFADTVCSNRSREGAEEQVKELFPEICPEAFLDPIATYSFIPPTEILCKYGEKDDCSIIDLTSRDDPRLEVFRKFRDEVLSGSAAGSKLIELYYDYSGKIIGIFDEYPSLKMHARELLDAAVPALQAVLNGGTISGFLGSQSAADADLLVEELDALMQAPLQENLNALKQEIVAE